MANHDALASTPTSVRADWPPLFLRFTSVSAVHLSRFRDIEGTQLVSVQHFPLVDALVLSSDESVRVVRTPVLSSQFKENIRRGLMSVGWWPTLPFLISSPHKNLEIAEIRVKEVALFHSERRLLAICNGAFWQYSHGGCEFVVIEEAHFVDEYLGTNLVGVFHGEVVKL